MKVSDDLDPLDQVSERRLKALTGEIEEALITHGHLDANGVYSDTWGETLETWGEITKDPPLIRTLTREARSNCVLKRSGEYGWPHQVLVIGGTPYGDRYFVSVDSARTDVFIHYAESSRVGVIAPSLNSLCSQFNDGS